MINIIAKAFLFTTNEFFIISVICIGYFSEKRPAFCRALFIFLLTLILNPYLKSLWQIPLAAHLGKEGYAFPSGHMQSAMVFWGWLAFEFFNIWFFSFAFFLLVGIGLSLIHFGYHSLTDIMGAVFFAVLTLVLYYGIFRLLKNKNLGLIGILLALFSMIIIYFLPNPTFNIWIALGSLVGFSFGCSLINKSATLTKNKMIKIALAFVGAGFIYYAFGIIKPLVNEINLLCFTQFFILALWISFGANYIGELKLFSLQR